ncbi:MAG: ketoacyl-ACP synthase III [Bacteroidota bacterium]
MFINSIAHYLPEQILTNEHFSKLIGLTEDDIFKKSGIKQRRVTGVGENTNTMSVKAAELLQHKIPFDIKDVDLIVGATYSPHDTVATLAHQLQHFFKIENAQVVSVSTACSSFVNAMEIVEGYFAMNKASKALVVVSEHNTIYNDENNTYSGFLWGDGAAAMSVTKERFTEFDVEVIEIETRGYAHFAKAMHAVNLRPLEDRIQMGDGKDVFINASKLMSSNTQSILEHNGFTIKDLTYLIPHQANMRIINKVGDLLGLHNGSVVTNIEYLGNTGSASSAIALSQTWDKLQKDNLAVVTVFGGGYSSGCMLLKK